MGGRKQRIGYIEGEKKEQVGTLVCGEKTKGRAQGIQRVKESKRGESMTC